MNFGKNVERFRTAKKMTQAELGNLVDVRQGYISAIELGKCNPSLKLARRIASVLGVTLDSLDADPDSDVISASEPTHEPDAIVA